MGGQHFWKINKFQKKLGSKFCWGTIFAFKNVGELKKFRDQNLLGVKKIWEYNLVRGKKFILLHNLGESRFLKFRGDKIFVDTKDV